MVLRHLDIEGVTIGEPKTDSPLVVDRDGVPAKAIAHEPVEPIPWRNPKVVEARRHVDGLE